MKNAEIFFFGNCQISKISQLYGSFQKTSTKMIFRSITPYFGEYCDNENKNFLENASLAVVQLINSDYIFNRKRVLDIRGGKPTIFVPYVYLTGFRVLEKISSKGVLWIDGEDILTSEMKSNDNPSRAAVRFMKGLVPGENKARFEKSLAELMLREKLGSDIKIASYIRESYKERLPCYSINHPTPHILLNMYNQVSALAGFNKITESSLSAYDKGRVVLPKGNGGLSPYCVSSLELNYEEDSHWFPINNRLALEISRKWTRINQKDKQ